ncbi:MAG: AAA family ATPase [Gammaproteobacteria bacterium]|nr:AAA family ATPase [Gammaproteobacteria bacterium]
MPKCTLCQFANPGNNKFCGQCGASLEEDAIDSTPTIQASDLQTNTATPDSAKNISADRRQLTVMFCDLADPPLPSDDLNAEECQDIIRRYQTTCTKVIDHLGGHLAPCSGEGVLAYFGYPKANEDDARRAVYSALNCIKAITKLNKPLRDKTKRLHLRIGIHTGLVVIGELGKGSTKEHLVVGRTPSMAINLQNLADSNQVLITSSTYHLVRHFFKVNAQGQKTLRNIPNPIDVYHVIQKINETDRNEAIEKQNQLTPIVGRQNELQKLNHLWDQVLAGQGKVALIVGETGIGKSRLLHAFKEKITTQPGKILFLTAYGSKYNKTSSLRSMIEMLERIFGFTSDMNISARFKLLETHLSETEFDLADYLPLFSNLLNLPLADHYTELNLTSERKKKQTLEVLCEYIFKLSLKKPLLFVIEDLHWIDPSSLAFFEILIQKSARHKILTLFISRPKFKVPWHPRSEITLLNLNPLTDQDIAFMVEKLTQGSRFPQILIDEIIKKTDGIPLFVEEITQMVLKSKTDNPSKNNNNERFAELSIPASLQELLTARLDDLGPVRHVAQLAAVIGREFSYSLLEKITENEATLRQDLQVLLNAELITQDCADHQCCYLFKHVLTQELALSSMLKTQRQKVHLKIAQIAETQNPEIVATMPEYIALHYTHAGDMDSAIDWWLQAGELALTKFANIEAISHLEQGIRLSEKLPATPIHGQRELRLQSAIGAAYCATTGYASKEVERTYSRAWELCKQLDDNSEQFPILWGQWAFHVVRANLHHALEITVEMIKSAKAKKDTNLLLEAKMASGLTQFFLGNFEQAKNDLAASIEADHDERDRSFTFRSGQDAGVCARSYLALTLWILGHPREAIKCSENAINLARKLDHPFSLAYALNFAGWLYYMLRDPKQAKKCTEEELKISAEHEFFWLQLGSVVAGWAETQLGAAEQGLIQIQQGIKNYSFPGAQLSQTLLLSIQASVCLELGQLDECKQLLDEAVNAIHDTQETFWLTEIYRLLGLLAQKQDQSETAHDYLNQSMALAQTQAAPMLQLRAAASLVRCATAETHAEALQLLVSAYANIDKDSTLVDCRNAEQLINPLG